MTKITSLLPCFTTLLPCFTRILFVELYLIISASLEIQKKIFYFFMISDQYALFFCIHPYLLQFFKTLSTNTCYMYVCHGLFCLFISRSLVWLRVMNNPGLLTDNAASIDLMTNLPSNSPAAKKLSQTPLKQINSHPSQ